LVNSISAPNGGRLLPNKTPFNKEYLPGYTGHIPYKKEIYKGDADNSEKQDCSICFDALEDGQEIAYTTLVKEDGQTEIPAGKLHCNCMMQYLHSQTQNLWDTEGDNVFTFKCPFRNKITFTRCKLDIQFAYKTTL
jgi:hypothetical protein